MIREDFQLLIAQVNEEIKNEVYRFKIQLDGSEPSSIISMDKNL